MAKRGNASSSTHRIRERLKSRLELATGCVDAIAQRVGATLAEPHARIAELIRSASVVTEQERSSQRQPCWGHLVRDFNRSTSMKSSNDL